MKLGKVTFRLAAWLLERGGNCAKGEGVRRLRRGLRADIEPVIVAGTLVEVRCPMCFKEFRYSVPADNAPVRLYCSGYCSGVAAKRRNNPNYVKYCASPDKNKYPTQVAAVAVMGTMRTGEAWKLNAYPCPVGHWHIGRVQGRIIETPNEKEK